MAKITVNTLPPATTPLAGTEELLVVQSGLEKNTTVNQIRNSADMETLKDFREWDGTGSYSTNNPTFRLGIPYRLKAGGNPANDPATSPTDWEVVGGGAGTVGNIAPDPDGSQGDTGWAGTVATVANGLTGFATELSITANSVWTIPVPAQLQGEALELRFEAFVNAGTGITVKTYSDSGATVEIPMTSTGLNASGKTAFIGKFWAVGANVYLKVAGTAFDLRMTNIYVGRPETVQGAVISEWMSYTPTFQGFGTPTAVDFKYRRNGGNIDVKGKFTTGITTAVEARIGLPSPYTSRGDVPTLELVGTCATSPNQSQVSSILSEPSVPHMTLGVFNASGLSPLAKLLGNSYASSIVISFTASIPCAQFTSSMTIVGMNEPFFLSNSESVVNTNGVAGKTQVGTWAPILANTANTYYDLTLPRPLMLGEKPKIILRSKVDGNSVPAELASTVLVRTLINVGQAYQDYGMSIRKPTANQVRIFMGSVAGLTSAGAPTSWANFVSAADGYDAWMVEISRGGEAWAVPPMVYAEATGTAVANGVCQFNNVIEDTHTRITTGASWRFTVVTPGRYEVSVFADSPNATGAVIARKNGTDYQNLFGVPTVAWAYNGSVRLKCLANDYIDIRGSAAMTTNTRIQITRIGA